MKKAFKIVVTVIIVVIVAMSIIAFFFFGGFKIFEANRAEAIVAPMATYIEDLGGVKLCDAGDKGLDPINGSGKHSYYTYYQISDTNSITINLVDIANSNNYSLEADKQYIKNLQNDISNPKSATRDRVGITYNLESEYLTARNRNTPSTLNVRIYRNSSVILTCKSEWPRQLPESGKSIVYMYVNGI